MLFVEGGLSTRKWTDADGAERATTEVVVQSRAGGQVRILGARANEAGKARPATAPAADFSKPE